LKLSLEVLYKALFQKNKKTKTEMIGHHSRLRDDARLLPNKYFKEPRRAKAEKLGAQQIKCWEQLLKL